MDKRGNISSRNMRLFAAIMTLIEALVLISLAGCAGKKVDYGVDTEVKSQNVVKLGYIRLKDASAKDKYTYVPAWCLSKQDKGYDRYPVYVNAIDGTIIRIDDLI